MTTAQDLFAQGSHAFTEEDYEEALSFYSQAIEVNGTHAEVFLKRSATYQKLGKDKEAYEDAVFALGLIKEKPSSDVTVEAKAQLRKGVAAYHLQDYQTAKVALEACKTLSPEQRTLASWIRKNEQELAKLPKAAVTATPATVAAAAPAADVTPVVSAVASPTSTPAPAPLTPAAHRVLSTKIEIQLKKEVFAIKWGALEGDDVNAGSMAAVSASATSAYPTSSKKAKNWDALAKEAANEEDKADGDKALNQLFSQIYKDADDDTRRAMMKSFTESNGTCLSTNWDEVGKGTVETRPPEGMIAKKYSA
ncbi:Protein SGT1 A [Mortierella sp. AD032]|nr:Protein SGT1 A [Mortierella sp. AD032]